MQPCKGSPGQIYHSGWGLLKPFHMEHRQGVVEAELAVLWAPHAASAIKVPFIIYLILILILILLYYFILFFIYYFIQVYGAQEYAFTPSSKITP